MKSANNQLDLFAFTQPVVVPARRAPVIIEAAPLTPWQQVMAIPVMVLAAAAAGLYDGKRPDIPKGRQFSGSVAGLVANAYGEGLTWRYGDGEDGFTPLHAVDPEMNDHFQTRVGGGRIGGAE